MSRAEQPWGEGGGGGGGHQRAPKGDRGQKMLKISLSENAFPGF